MHANLPHCHPHPHLELFIDCNRFFMFCNVFLLGLIFSPRCSEDSADSGFCCSRDYIEAEAPPLPVAHHGTLFQKDHVQYVNYTDDVSQFNTPHANM